METRQRVTRQQALQARAAGERLFAARARLDGRTRDAQWHEREAIRLDLAASAATLPTLLSAEA